MSARWESDLALAREVAERAGALIESRWGTELSVDHKGVVDLVSEVDLAAEELIVGELRARRPDDQILAEEETGDTLSSRFELLSERGGRVWCVDPLDGTTNFSHGFPQFCVSIALLERGEPVVGVIYEPLRRWTFWAYAGGGAWLNGRRLHVSSQAELERALLATGFPYDRHTSSHDNLTQASALLKRCQGLRRAGAAALDLAFVAAGWLDGYWEYKLKPWDVAAGALLVSEAGGVLSDTDGGEDWLTRGAMIAAGSGELHTHILETLREATS